MDHLKIDEYLMRYLRMDILRQNNVLSIWEEAFISKGAREVKEKTSFLKGENTNEEGSLCRAGYFTLIALQRI